MSSNYSIEVYTERNKAEVLKLFKLNTPNYFSPDEEKDLIYYLDNELEDYFLLKVNDQLIGCGGINYHNNSTAKISWDFLHPDFHSKGLGTKLLTYRLDFIKKKPNIKNVMVRTSQLSYKFYEKNGFKLKETQKDYWAPGFDLYLMLLK